MQWLIDIVLEAVAALGYLTTSFVDRGAITAADWDAGVLSMDSAWHTLDASSIIPEGTKAILVHGWGWHESIGKKLSLRKDASSGTAKRDCLHTQVATLPIAGHYVVAVTANRTFQYMAISPAWEGLTITILGWWL